MTAAESTSNVGYGRQYPTLLLKVSAAVNPKWSRQIIPSCLACFRDRKIKGQNHLQHVGSEIACYVFKILLLFFVFNLCFYIYIYLFYIGIKGTETSQVKQKIDGSNKALVWLDFLLQHSCLPLKSAMTNQPFNKNVVIMTRHQLLMAGGAVFGSMRMLRWQVNSASEGWLCDLQWLAVVLFEKQQVVCVLGFLLLVNLSLFGTSVDSQETWAIRFGFLGLDLVASWAEVCVSVTSASQHTSLRGAHKKHNLTSFTLLQSLPCSECVF